MEHDHSFTMTDQDRVIDNADLSDAEKTRVHNAVWDNQEHYLYQIGDLIESVLGLPDTYYVETTNQGLNLRFVVREDVDEIVAIAEKSGLTTVERSRTNPENQHVWLRFKLLTNSEIEPQSL